ncbi:glycosyltransferase family 4 protein [Sulfuricystis multivorans]|uniref:glycosyltransferase family 4 protein n=1 Tax=Sulfuricystis multivorans TaxID=2211108 RepID=UPI000F8349A8|nr:glycosyltransferase family 4 protein [Sulfuricystis multivorans]
MKTVAIITSFAPSLANFRGPLIREIASRGHRVVTLAPDFDEESRTAVHALGAETQDYPLSRTGMNPLHDSASLMALYRSLTVLRPDVVLSYFIKPVIYGTMAAAWAAVPHRVAMIPGLGFAFTVPGAPLNIKRRMLQTGVSILYRLALQRAHVVLTFNPDDAKELKTRGLARPARVSCVGGTGVDLDEWPGAALPSLPEHPITFAMAARLLREKGVREYVAAARIIKARHPDVRFLLLGGLDENPGAIGRAEVESWADEGVIEWLGHVAVKPWLTQTHVYVLPSYREGVPRSTQEAMAMGRAVITTDAPGCRETVVPGHNGFLVPVRDAPALAAAMERFILEPDLISSMGATSRRLAEERFDVRKINAQLLRILGL